MTEQRQIPQFGKRRPTPAQALPAVPVKRSGHVALLLMGTLAVGGGAYALMPGENCQPPSPGMAAPTTPQAGCTPRGGGGSGGGYSRSTHFSFYGGNSSDRSSSATSSDSNSSHVTRGGFGSFAHAFGFSGHA